MDRDVIVPPNPADDVVTGAAMAGGAGAAAGSAIATKVDRRPGDRREGDAIRSNIKMRRGSREALCLRS